MDIHVDTPLGVAVYSQGRWRAQSESLLEELKALTVEAEVEETIGGQPNPDFIIAEAVATKIGGTVMDEPPQSVVKDGVVY